MAWNREEKGKHLANPAIAEGIHFWLSLTCLCSPLPLQIYKSTKCNDMQQSGSCPRGPFCAFAHVERMLFPLSWAVAPSLTPVFPLCSGSVKGMPLICQPAAGSIPTGSCILPTRRHISGAGLKALGLPRS